MRFGVLGPLTVSRADGETLAVPEAKVRLLLADLLANAGAPVGTDRLIDDLWGGHPPADPRAALRVKVSQLRRVVGRDRVVHTARGYLLRVADTDAADFERLVTRASVTPDPAGRAALLTEALGLWRGDAFAEHADEHFARPVITRLDERRLAAVEELAEARLALGEHALVTAELAALVAEHPTRERLRAAHLLALYRSGRQAEAVEGFAAHRVRLRDELGLDPGPALAGLHRAMLAQDPSLLAPPGTTISASLPVAATPLFGREDELGALGELLGRARLVTLHGPGGVGKTRLALAAAVTEFDAAFADLAALAAGASQEGVAAVVAVALGLREDAAGDFEAAVAGRRTLLVLDNCEHVLDGAADLVALLLKAAPELRVLATSREPLGLSAEHVRAVAPLPEAASARLFAERAAAAGVPVDLSEPETAATVTGICRRLDGIPLAVELAAARAPSLGLGELAARLADRFALLTHGPRDAPARQRTLRAVVDWSWEPLPPAEKAVLRRLSVHAGGCDLAAAEQVCAGDGVAIGEVAGLLARLAGRSLVTVAHSAGRSRYRLLSTVAAYGLERLIESGETDAVRRRHRHHYLRLAERLSPLLRGPDQLRALAVHDAEAANLRAALRDAVAAEPEVAESLAAALAWYWHLRGRRGEAREALAAVGGAEAATWRAVLDITAGTELDPVSRAREASAADPRPEAAWLLSDALFGLGALSTGERLNDRALDDFASAGDDWGVAVALVGRARRRVARGEFVAARADATRALSLVDDRWVASQAAEELAAVAEITGSHTESARLRARAVADAEELGLPVAHALARLGRTALVTGDLARARELHERALDLATAAADEGTAQFAEVGLALTARRQGALDEAEARLTRWLAWCRRRDGEAGLALISAELGFIAELRGEEGAALANHREGLAAARRFGDPRALALALEGLAGAHALGGRLRLAAARLARAQALRAEVGAPLPPAERGDTDRIRRAIESRTPQGAGGR
ncbi:BTAD domain-containing putative transcriptional regulator [Phytomonospora sp. NPDC050363]|uniref:ATP-binding protein n=1 Tax=Phytomonospora sp. NPDC050363 TaxID=3155642 RepID=UPI00340064C2